MYEKIISDCVASEKYFTSFFSKYYIGISKQNSNVRWTFGHLPRDFLLKKLLEKQLLTNSKGFYHTKGVEIF